MYQYKGMNDTIAAVSTPSGEGGIAIVRVSGCGTFVLLEKIFVSSTSASFQDWPGFTARHGWIVDPVSGERVDEVVVTLMRAPKSYTCEDIVEISCHGGSVVVRAVLELVVRQGARLAEPGEFTKRAFCNGRIDLAQAEAVAGVIAARSEAARRVSSRQLDGALSRELAELRERLVGVLAGIEAFLNFPEDNVDHGQSARLQVDVSAVIVRLKMLLATARCGRILREGARVVICGKPNVGKSSLLNALLRAPRAIVTDVAGTTRDTIEETAQIAGIPVSLVDTAGILIPRDKIEEEAVRRSQEAIASADIVLAVFDRSRPLEDVDRSILARLSCERAVLVLNKSDLPKVAGSLIEGIPVCEVSAVTGQGMQHLEELIRQQLLGSADMNTNAVMLTQVRHVEALQRSFEELEHAMTALKEQVPLEAVSEDIKRAVNGLDAVTGRDVDHDVIDRIFSGFCIGK